MTAINKPYYTVNEHIFINKIDAILYAMANGNQDVKWNFYKESFKKVNWTIEPDITIDELYRRRAIQIRESYDYVVVLCSGGADSTNVVKTFLNYGVKIDEIIAGAPMSGLRDYQFNDKDASGGNTISETVYTQLPLIKEIAAQYPSVKITIHDYFEDMLAYKTDDWLVRSEDWIHPSSAAKYRFERYKHLRDIADSGKKIAFVYGIDKPKLVRAQDDNFYVSIADLAYNVMRPPFDRDYPNVDNVAFYWTGDMPEIVCKQSHLIARFVMDKKNSIAKSYMYDLNNVANYTSFELIRLRHGRYERAIVPCIYPSTYTNIFQTEKPLKLFLSEEDDWFYILHNKTRTYELIQSDTKSLHNMIDKKYLNQSKSGFENYTNYYKIGPVQNFIS